MEKKTRQKVERELQVKEYCEQDNRVYFKTLNNYVVFLPKSFYFQKLHRLQDYFSDRPEAEKQRLIKENLAIGATSIEDDLSQIKAEKVYQSCFCEVWKFSNYPPSWDGKDIDPRPFDIRENENLNPWRTERNDWISEYARKIRNWLRGDKD